MLTINKPVHYGYKSIHDLPTPPNTSRPSPPLMYQESQKPLGQIPRSRSPPSQLMSGSYRGLPPPAALSSGQPLPPASHPPPPPGPPAGQGPPLPPQQPTSQSLQLQQQQAQAHGLGQLSSQLPPPPGWQSSEDAMRAWLHAKAEEEKRRQEEERTNQERFRLEQRKTEFEILRASLQGGIPPQMVPVVFAGMGGGTLPPAALDWAQQFAQQANPQQLLPGPTSPGHRRDSHPQVYAHYQGSGGVPSTPGSAQGTHGSFVGGYPSSPRTRGYTMPVSGSRAAAPGGSSLSSLNTSVLPSLGPAAAAQSHPGVVSAQQQESQQSPSIYFHMWQPPSSQSNQSGSNQPATPSAIGESPRKRKAAGPQQPAPPPSTQHRFRSPPFSQSTGSTISNPPPGRRRGHSRQTSDASTTYRRGRAETIGSTRGMSPMSTSGPSTARETAGTPAEPSSFTQPPPVQARNAAHSVSSLLSSDEPLPHMAHYPLAQAADTRGPQGKADSRQGSPHSSEERSRAGGAGNSSPAGMKR